MNRPVGITRGQRTAVRAPSQPLAHHIGVTCARSTESEDGLFAIDVPDSDQAVVVPEASRWLAGCHATEQGRSISLRTLGSEGPQILVRERVEVEPLPAAAVWRIALGNPVGEQFAHVRQAAVFPPSLLGQVHLRIVEILLGNFGRLSARVFCSVASFSAFSAVLRAWTTSSASGPFRRRRVALALGQSCDSGARPEAIRS